MINLLQIEAIRDGAYLPEGYDPLNITNAGLPTGISNHATEVNKILKDGLNKAGVDHKIFHGEITTYAGRSGLGVGLYSGPLNFYRWPAKAIANVECGACAITSINLIDGLSKIDKRIERDNVISVWSMPNAGQENTPSGMARALFNQAQNVITVGCTNGNHHEWSTTDAQLSSNANRKADVLGPLEWTSYNAPYVSAIAAAVAENFINKTGSYDWKAVKFCVVTGVKNKNENLVGEADMDMAIEMSDRLINYGILGQ